MIEKEGERPGAGFSTPHADNPATRNAFPTFPPARHAPIPASLMRKRMRRGAMTAAAGLLGVFVAGLGGLAIGIERQRSGHASGPNARFGGSAPSR